jgi:hypothetical protein
LLELAGSIKDSSQYANKVKDYLGGTRGASTWTDSNTVETCTVSGVNKGSHSYDIEIIRDTEPDAYSAMNGVEMITFGESGKQSVLADASTKGNQFMGSGVHGYDKMALDYFVSLRNDKIRTDNLGLATPMELIDPNDRSEGSPNKALLEEIESYIDRDVYFEVVPRPSDKMELIGIFSYEVSTALDLMDGTVRTIEYPFFWSGSFSKGNDTSPGANKIDSVYVLYSPCSYEKRNETNNVDVRIWDPDELLFADVFLVWQEGTASVSETLNKTLQQRFPDDGAGEQNIEVCFAKKGYTTEQPGRVDLYSSVMISCSDLSSSNGSKNPYKMVPVKNGARIQTLTINIKDSNGNVVASESNFACLQ